MPVAASDDAFGQFFRAVDKFFSSLAEVHWGSLAAAMAVFGIYLTLRSRASFHVLRAAYGAHTFRWRDIWGAYMAGYGFNSVIPARGGDVIRLFLTKTSIPDSSYPAVAASFVVELVFDAMMATLIVSFAATQGVLPTLPELPGLDLGLLVHHPRFAAFLVTFVLVATLATFALLSVRVKLFWARVRQGFAILSDRRRFAREVLAVQLCAWFFRCAAFWLILEAFNIGGSVRNVLLVLGVQAISAIVPFTPGGAGVQQGLIVKVFGGTATAETIAAYSVGQQIAIGVFTFAVGFIALITVFRIRSFKEVVARGREEREADKRAAAARPA